MVNYLNGRLIRKFFSLNIPGILIYYQQVIIILPVDKSVPTFCHGNVGKLMALIILEAGVSPCNTLSSCSLGLLIDDLALATIWIVVLFVDIFVYLDVYYAAYQAFLVVKM